MSFVKYTLLATTCLLGQASAQDDHFTKDIQPLLQEHCFSCHGADKQKGDLRIDTLSDIQPDIDNLNTWYDILDQIEEGEMPPKKEPQLNPENFKKLTSYIDQKTQEAKEKLDSNQHATVLRRLNKEQYKNTIRDLLNIDISVYDPTSEFPADEKEHHFRTNGEALVTSNFLLNEKMKSAKVIADKILKDLEQPKAQAWSFKHPFLQTKKKHPNEANYAGMSQANRMAGSLSSHYHTIYQNTQDKKGYMWLHDFRQGVPHDGYYKVSFRVQARNQNHTAPTSLVPTDKSEKLRAAISVANESYGPISLKSHYDKDLETFVLEDGKETWISGTYWIDKGFSPRLSFPSGVRKIKVVKTAMSRKEEYFKTLPYAQDVVKYAHKLEAQLASKKKIVTPKTKGKMMRNTLNTWERFLKAYVDFGPNLRCYEAKIEGPFYNTWPIPSYQTLVGQQSIEKSNPYELIENLAIKAFRGFYQKGYLQPLFALMKEQETQGASKKDLIKMGLVTILCSDQFNYFQENENTLNDIALANRLSYFIWGTMPDKTLLYLAKSNQLSKASHLKEQTLRLLKDERSFYFVKNFSEDWLQLNKIGQMRPDPKQASIYYQEKLENHMKQETYLFFQDILQNNLPISNFLQSDFTYMNKGLGKFYHQANYQALPKDQYQRVKVTDKKRGGLLSQMSVLTATANGVDTSPILRGVWVLENILGNTPPPPPEDVSAVEPDTRGTTTIREQLVQHREVESCKSCHQKIDPAGWALESFDAIGQFRKTYAYSLNPHEMDKESQLNIDSSSTFHTGENYKNFEEYRNILLSKQDEFTECLTSKILTFATGRNMEGVDKDEIRNISNRVLKSGGKLQDLILEVVTSSIFTSK